MASSLLFRIKSIFEGQGFQQAKSAFAGTLGTIGKLTAGLAGVALNAKNLGRAFAVFTAIDIAKGAAGILKFLYNAAPAAARAEVTFTRLKTQLGLVGKASKENLKLIEKYSQDVAKSVGFTQEAVQKSVTTAVRRTGDVSAAIKQVQVAQDLAAATGYDLETATNLINRAQQGYYRSLIQITNLRQADIEAARKQGTLLDLLSSKFGGAAAKQADTYAAKMERLANVNEQTRESLGKLGLPFRKFVADVKLMVANVALASLEMGKWAASGGPIFGLIQGFNELKKTSDDVKKSLKPGKEFTFDLDKAFEVQTKRLGKTRDERQQIARDIVRVESLLQLAAESGSSALSEEQVALLSKYQFASKQLNDIINNEVTKMREDAKKSFEDTKKIQDRASQKTGFVKTLKDIADFTANATKAQVPIAEIAKELNKTYGVSKLLAPSMAEFGAKAIGAFTNISNAASDLKANLDNTFNSSIIDKLSFIGQEIGKSLTVKAQPKLNVNVQLGLTEQLLQAAVNQAIATQLPRLLSIATESTKKGAKEAVANGSLRK